MSVEAPVLPAAPAETQAAPAPAAPPSPEVQERLVFGRVMVLLIVPIYFLIVLTLEEGVKRRFPAEWVALMFNVTPARVWAVLRGGYHAMVAVLCAVPVVYGLVGVVRFCRKGVCRGYLLTACSCFVAALVEAVVIGLAFFWFHVSA